MKQEQDHIRDLAEIRSMMERSSKFLSLSGWSGVLAGIYALAGGAIVYYGLQFNPNALMISDLRSDFVPDQILKVIFLAITVLLLAVITAVYHSFKKAGRNGEKIWNATSRRVLENMLVPLLVGGILIVILFSKELIGLIAPMMLLFYGLALYTTGKFTISEVRYLGIIQIILGLISAVFIEYGLLFWTIGFGVLHIIYGIYIHYKYER